MHHYDHLKERSKVAHGNSPFRGGRLELTLQIHTKLNLHVDESAVPLGPGALQYLKHQHAHSPHEVNLVFACNKQHTLTILAANELYSF